MPVLHHWKQLKKFSADCLCIPSISGYVQSETRLFSQRNCFIVVQSFPRGLVLFCWLWTALMNNRIRTSFESVKYQTMEWIARVLLWVSFNVIMYAYFKENGKGLVWIFSSGMLIYKTGNLELVFQTSVVHLYGRTYLDVESYPVILFYCSAKVFNCILLIWSWNCHMWWPVLINWPVHL